MSNIIPYVTYVLSPLCSPVQSSCDYIPESPVASRGSSRISFDGRNRDRVRRTTLPRPLGPVRRGHGERGGGGGAAAKTKRLGHDNERPAEALETARREVTLEPG